MIRELIESEKADRLLSIEGEVDRSKSLYENPANKAFIACCAIRGLDVSVKSLWSLARRFSDSAFFILCQNQESLEHAELIEVESAFESEELRRELNAKFPGIFTGDIVVSWGKSHRWYVIFDPQLALGVLIAKSRNDMAAAREAYSQGDDLIEVAKGFAECADYELQRFPSELRNVATEQLFESWGISNNSTR